MKYFFDIFLAVLLFPLIFLPLIIFILISKIENGSSGIFVQERIGKNAIPFKIYKLRTHNVKTNKIKTISSFFRKYKIDELPQIVNIIKGDMSFVGPRPDIKGYADKLQGENRKILLLRPGITGPASLKYSNEEELLAKQDDPIKYNNEVIYPDKVKINLEYYHNRSFFGDLKIIFNTIFRTNY